MYGWTRSARWAGSWPDGWGSRSDRPAAAPCEGRSGRAGLGLAEELLEEPAGGGTALALVLAPPVLRPVRAVGRRGQPEERDLADLHAGVDRDRKVGDVGELEGEVAVPPGVDVAGRGVDEQAEPAERRLALQAGHEVVGEPDPLEGRSEDELAGVEDEGGVALDGDQLGQVGHGGLHVDEGVAGVVERAERAVDVQVDRGRLDALGVEGIDLDPARGDLLGGGPVGPDHRRPRVLQGRRRTDWR